MSASSAIRAALEDGFARGDEASLVAFYDALLAGELLVAVGGGEAAFPVTLADGTASVLGGVRGVAGEAVVAAFTGAEELDAWAGSGSARLTVAVVPLATALLDTGVHELSLNPAGPVGRRVGVVDLRQLAGGLAPRCGRASFGFEPRSGVAVGAPTVAPDPALVAALQAVCAHNSDVAAAYVVEMMQPRRSGDVDLAVALQLDATADGERRQALLELVGEVVTSVPDAGLDGVGFLWLDARLEALVRARVPPAYERPRGR